MPENQSSPVKLKDIIEAYEYNQKLNPDYYEEKEREGKEEEKEGLDYHFNRWAWYMGNHLDQDGYIVSPVKNYVEWLKFTNKGARNKTTATVNTSNWAFQGPTSSSGGYEGIGRINGMGFHPTDPNTFWIASAGGGAWRTTNNGVSWSSMTHMLPVLGTSDVDIDPLTPSTIYLCTGDKDASDTYSIGVMKSTNSGATWDTTGLKWTVTQNRLTNMLVINKINTNTILVATSNGIYRSTNAGVIFTQVRTGHFKDILYHPTDTNIVYAATNNASGSAQIWRSANGGANWTQVTNFSGKGRIALAVSPADVKIVKAIVTKSSNNGLDSIYTSSDTGKTYTRTYGPNGCNGDLISGDNKTAATNCGRQGWYDLCICLNPANANEVLVGGVNTWRSTNGGTSWSIVTQWWAQLAGVEAVHADKHYMSYHPLVAGRLFQGNDGGVYYTDNPASLLWNDVTNGMGITQFYRNAVSHTANQFILGGSQDNGTKGLANGTWSAEGGGDGMDCQIDYTDSNTYYTAIQNGDLNRHSAIWGDASISNNIPGNPAGPWITPYIITPQNPAHLIAGYQKLYHSSDYGDTWDSVTLTRLDPSQDVKRVAMTLASTTTIYAVVNNSNKVFYTHSWLPGNTAIFSSYTAPYSGTISDIVIDHKNKDHFWVTFSGYGSAQVAEYNAGTWSQINTNLPDVPVHCITIDTSNYNKYIGTDIGVFYFDTVSKQWEVFNNGNAMPSIEVTDLSIHYKKNTLWASTYGRGMWKSVVQYYGTPPDTGTGTGIKLLPFANHIINIFPNPSNGAFTVTVDASLYANKSLDLRLLDMTGKTVWSNTQKSDAEGVIYVRTSGLARGFYMLDINTGKEQVGRQKITIE